MGKSDEKSKIDFKDAAVDAIAMLEQIKGEDAQDIIHMFKELMASYDIVFEETEGTKQKQQLFSKVIKDYSSGELLTDGDDCVYRANIPPTQEGFEKGMTVQAPCKGKITYRTDDAVCIEINEPNEDYDKYTILISGFEVKDIEVGQSVDEGTKLGETMAQDLKLVLRDENGAIVKNKYVTTTTDGQYIGNSNTDVRVDKTAPKYTLEQLKETFGKYGGAAGQNLSRYADSFYKLQTDYGVDPLFAAAVAIKEQSAGTANSTCSRQNNWFSVRSGDGWASFSSPKESIDGFGNLIANGSYYFTQNRFTIGQIGQVYCVPPDSWIEGVSSIMKKLESYN